MPENGTPHAVNSTFDGRYIVPRQHAAPSRQYVAMIFHGAIHFIAYEPPQQFAMWIAIARM